MKSQQRGWPNDDSGSLDATSAEEQRPEAEQDSVERREIGCASSRPVDDQELLLHEEAVGDNSPRAPRPQKSGDRPQEVCEE